MYSFLQSRITKLYSQSAPATGIGLFRLLFGLVTLQEILFLQFFSHLIFDPIPFLDVEFPMISFFLWLWFIVALCVTFGYRSQQAIIANYLFWIIFVHFTPMQRDFDGGFDLFMIGANFFLIFLPFDKAFSLDQLRKKLAQPFVHYSSYPKERVSVLAYTIPVTICLGFLYFDSAVHKMFAEHWRNGLGAWLPSSMPYYVSALDMTWLLNNEALQKIIGYTILVFQFTFVFLVHYRHLRPLYFLIGIGLHLGITLTFNIYPFGLGMLVFYTLVAPFSWYERLGKWLTVKKPRLIVFYDEHCPLCNRTVLTLNHFDVFSAIDFKGGQSHAKDYPQIKKIGEQTLLTDLYALDGDGRIYSGVDTYARILINMRYTALLGWLLLLPGIYQAARHYYRKIADTRERVSCDESCLPAAVTPPVPSLYDRIFNVSDKKQQKKVIRRLCKILMLIFLLQLNSTLHYGLIYRLDIHTDRSPIVQTLSGVSNMLIMLSQSFLGITPHALYLHDHFAGYNHLIAITYKESGQDQEKWLPFVDKQGRMLAPNWGRVHSMWANIAVTPKIDNWRLEKAIMKVTAFWGIKSGLDLDKVTFLIKMKKIQSPVTWKKDLLQQNFSGDWETIGSAKWAGKVIDISLPKDINDL